MRIQRRPVSHPDAVNLIEQVQRVYVALYGGEDVSPVRTDEFADPLGAFFVGYVDDRPVASGAWRLRPDLADLLGRARPAEIKRMYVVPSHQRRGLARQMLAHLEATARAAGATDLVLETGAPQRAAIAFYEAAGYTPVPGFGHYQNEPESRCYARPL